MSKSEFPITETVTYRDGLYCDIITMYYDGNPLPAQNEAFVPLHWHRDIEINYTWEGNLTMQLDGKNIQSNKEEFTIVNSKSIHGKTRSTSPVDGNARILGVVIRVSDNLFRQMLPNFDSLCFNPLYCPKDKRPGEIALELSRYGFPDTKLQKYDNIRITSLLFELLYFLCHDDLTLKESIAGDTINTENMRQVMTYVEKNYMNPINEMTLATEFGYTQTYFSKIFKKCTGMPFREFLIRTRIAAAKSALTKTGLSVTEIALNTGFPDVRSLINAFGMRCGTTPGKFRKENRII